MAMQHIVRALIPASDEDTLRRELQALPGAGVLRVHSQQPPPATYRDEEPDRRLHQLWRATTGYLVVAALIGALVGVGIAFAVPGLRDYLPWTALVLGFGFGWGGAAFGWGRGVQVAKREDDLGEEEVRIEGRGAQQLRLLTIEVQQDREKVAEHLVARGAKLLDSRDPIVGDAGPLARPADPDGEVTPEGQRPGRDGLGGHVTRGRGSESS